MTTKHKDKLKKQHNYRYAYNRKKQRYKRMPENKQKK